MRKIKTSLKILLTLLFSLFLFAQLKTPDCLAEEEITETKFEEIVEELLREPSLPLNPLGATENNQKINDQKEQNTQIQIISLILIGITSIGIILIILSPLLRRKKKKYLQKF